jgi:CheY-like chemotaxis protein
MLWKQSVYAIGVKVFHRQGDGIEFSVEEKREKAVSAVLVVDDIDVVRLTLRKFLERGGHKVTACGSADEAEALLRTWTPDIVVTDLWMPGRDGLSLIRDVRQRHARLPVIAITGGAPGMAQTSSRDEATLAGADRVLLKPVGMQELLSAVQEALDRRLATTP